MKSEPDFSRQPFKPLGVQLKTVRQKANQTIAEVSGAVEVDIDFMQRIELGEQRPSEEVLLLLISHFGIRDDEAATLWELAAYTDDKNPANAFDPEAIKAFASILTPDLRIIYTDMVHTSANNQGITLNFLQTGGINGQPMIVSRLGMSKEQAKNVLETLQNTLGALDKKAQPKLLPQPRVKKKTDSN